MAMSGLCFRELILLTLLLLNISYNLDELGGHKKKLSNDLHRLYL